MMAALTTANNLAQFRKQLADLDKRTRNQIFSRAARNACKMLAADVKTRIPVETGALKKSVKVRAGKRKRDTIRMLVIITGGPDEVGVPAHVEYGTANMPARPFLRPAVAAKRDDMISLVESEVSKSF